MADFRANIPGWLDAVGAERKAHECSWAYPHDDICGIPVRHISLVDIARLNQIGNAFSKGVPSQIEFVSLPTLRREASDLICYLHVNQSRNPLVNMYRRYKYRRLNPEILHAELVRYFNDTYMDSLGAFEAKGDNEQVSLWHSIVEYIDTVSQEYGWTDEYIINMPYRRLIQISRKLISRKNPKAPISSVADRVVMRHLET